MKNLLISILGVAVFVVIAGLLISNLLKNKSSTDINRFTDLPKKSIYIGSLRINTEIADTEPLREKGLSGRSKIADDDGMLFIFDQKNVIPSFWMRKMEFPIDILWIRGNKIIQIDKNIQPPAKGVLDSKLKLYSPKEPVDYVLEVKGGYTTKNVVLTGSQIDLTQALEK